MPASFTAMVLTLALQINAALSSGSSDERINHYQESARSWIALAS